MKTFLSIAAILAWLFGAALLFAPGPFYQPAKIALTPMLATLSQAHSATIVGIEYLGTSRSVQCRLNTS